MTALSTDRLYLAVVEIWARNDAGHMCPLSVPGYGISQEGAEAEAQYRAGRYPYADEAAREELMHATYRSRP